MHLNYSITYKIDTLPIVWLVHYDNSLETTQRQFRGPNALCTSTDTVVRLSLLYHLYAPKDALRIVTPKYN
jgi:hypothetical protein